MRNPRDYGGRMSFHFGGRDSQDTHTVRTKPRVPCQVMLDLLQLLMPGTIDLHTQSCRRAVEVENVGSDRVLPAEAQSGLVAA